MPRRAHTKSRYGCDNCRRRRVKCDEQGPPCTNCILRRLDTCIYSRVLPASLLANSRRISQPSISPREDVAHLNGFSPDSSSPPLKNPKVDELELMHQFATDTYRSLCVSDDEIRTWQVLVPRLALKHRYLMNGILALASLHIASTLEPANALLYIDTGLEYHSLSLEPFRRAIDNLAPENCDAAFAHSVITTAISLALPQLTMTRENAARMTDNMTTVFELLQGVKKILTIGQSWINLKLFSQGAFWKNTTATLDADTDNALNQLATLNEQTRANGDEIQFSINRNAIAHLRHCFTKFAASSDPAPVLAWLAAVDKGFVDSLRRRQPFSLLVLAYWGLLLADLNGQRWWALNSGRALVSELLDALSAEDLLWESCLGWVQQSIASKSV
ncbi:hypothetical protein N7523_006140 [Penicillium sp. IBT 18751x]|nr:hypothetical protein N7523_006140 [Penicillium sp. IBT 18751x]